MDAMFNYLCVIMCCSCGLVTSLSQPSYLVPDLPDVTIDLSSYSKSSQVFLNYVNVSKDDCVLKIDVTNAPTNGGFFVIQFHSFKLKFSLSNERNESVTGRNTGLLEVNLQQNFYCYTLSCTEVLEGYIKVLVAVVVYEKEDPIPGGCNLTFNPEIAAYQNVTYGENMVQVDSQPASIYNSTCEKNLTYLETYHLYLREQTLDENEYFQGISKMLTADSIINNAYMVQRPEGELHGRRHYSAYLGTGAVYAVIARGNNRTSAYIPAVSYACNTDNWDYDCVAPTTTIWKIIVAILFFMGIFSLCAGHACFKVQEFLIGFVVGFYIGYIISGSADGFSVGASVALSTLFGIALGTAIGILWCRCGLPVVSASIPVLFVAYLICCIVFYSSIGDTELIRVNFNYWIIILSAIILSAIPLMMFTKFLHIFACSFLGATAICIAINHYAGGNLHNIFVNNYRRATVRGFNKAIIDPVFQYTDALLSVLCVILLGTGVAIQLRTTRGMAPFPPASPCHCGGRFFFHGRFRAGLSERSPLISND